MPNKSKVTSSNPTDTALDYLAQGMEQFPELQTCWGVSILYAIYVLDSSINLQEFVPALLKLFKKHNKIDKENGLRDLDKSIITDLNKFLKKYKIKSTVYSWDDFYDIITPAGKASQDKPKPKIIFMPALVVKQDKLITDKHVYILETLGDQAQLVDTAFIKIKPIDLDNLTVQAFKLQIDSERSIYPNPDGNLVAWERINV